MTTIIFLHFLALLGSGLCILGTFVTLLYRVDQPEYAKRDHAGAWMVAFSLLAVVLALLS